MSAFLYGVALQWKLDIRSKTLLITCYVVPLLFFALIGGIFTSINPEASTTLIQSMTVLGVTTGALIGLPPSLVEIYGSDIKKVYKANGVPLYLGVISTFLSAFLHLMIMSTIIYLVAPIAFGASLPKNPVIYFISLAIFIVISLMIGCALGLAVKNQAKLTMISQLVYLPSLMLSGIMFSADMLPKPLIALGKVFPATWGNKLMLSETVQASNLIPLVILGVISVVISGFLLSRKTEN